MELFRSPGFASETEKLMDRYHVPGLAIAIVHGELVDSEGFGHATLYPRIICTADTLFDIASCSKSLTAAAVGLLVDDNENFPEVQYDTAMSILLPEDFVMSGVGYTEGVTVEDILSHRSGLPGHDDSYMSVRAAKPDTARSITRNLRNLSVAAPIRSKYIYCNMMYTVASYLVEVKSGQCFGTFLEKRIFEPLGMLSTSAQPSVSRSKGFGSRMATGHRWKKAEQSYRDLKESDYPEGQGAGSVITSANDFIKWVRALMKQEGPINKNIFESLTRMRSFVNPNTTRRRPNTSPTAYAAGLDIYYYRGHLVIGHNGLFSGFGSRFFFLPDFEFGSVIMGNSEGADSVAGVLAQKLIDNLLGVEDQVSSLSTKQNEPSPSRNAHAKHRSKNKSAKGGIKENHSKVEVKRNPHPDAPEQRALPLSAYTGRYWNPGYHNLEVQVKEDKLFIDATDRSMAFTLTLEHICNGARYKAHLTDWLGGDNGDRDLIEAEFVVNNAKVMRLGLRLEREIKSFIWFEKA